MAPCQTELAGNGITRRSMGAGLDLIMAVYTAEGDRAVAERVVEAVRRPRRRRNIGRGLHVVPVAEPAGIGVRRVRCRVRHGR